MIKPVIAVVDGAPEFLELMYDMLTEQGYETILWSEGQGAFEMLVREQPDLVILDLWLEHPKAGEMVLGLMRVDPATKHIPVIISTTDPHLCHQRSTFLQDERCDVLVKPFDLADLQSKIEKMLQFAEQDYSLS